MHNINHIKHSSKNMEIIIMCGGVYDFFKIPKPLSVINGETLLERTIRLLKENGAEDIYISSNNEVFELYGKVLHHIRQGRRVHPEDV